MALTITRPAGFPPSNVIGARRESIRDVAFTGSYAAGGEAVTPGQVGLRAIHNVHGVVTEGAGATAALPVRWDATNGKVQLYESAASGSASGEKGAEAYAASTSGRLTFIGR
jgi:hypothetical protein